MCKITTFVIQKCKFSVERAHIEFWVLSTDELLLIIKSILDILKYIPRDKRQDLAPYNCAQHFRVQAVASTICLFTFSFFRRLAGGSTIAIILFSPPRLSDLSLPLKVHHTLSGNLEPMHMELLGEIGTNIARLNLHWNSSKLLTWHLYIYQSIFFVFSVAWKIQIVKHTRNKHQHLYFNLTW